MTTNLRRFPDLPTTLPKNLEFVLGLSPSAMTLGLGNIRALLQRLGRPEKRFRSIVVAGTNGKGSVTAMLASILLHNGYHVGRFTSPHVYSVNERVCVDGRPVPLEEMEDAAERVAGLRDELTFSYFEALTAIAFLVFAGRGVDYAVLETGLGGRFDATNTVEPDLSVVTSISLDHRRILGDSEEEILREKLGVTRRGSPLLIGRLSEPLQAIVREKSKRDSFPVVSLDDVGAARVLDADLFTTRVHVTSPLADYGVVELPFPGGHQTANALLAVGAAERVTGRLENLDEALSQAYLPGRFESVEEGGKTFILDVAHNDEALSATIAQLSSCSVRDDNALVLGLMRRKELFEFPRLVASSVRRVYLVAPSGGDALTPAELFGQYLGGCLKDAGTDTILWNRRGDGDADYWPGLIRHIEHPDNPCRRILVTGSHHVVEHFGRCLFSREDMD